VSTPATRTLPAVLREALATGPGLQLVVGTCGETLPMPDSDSYARVVVNGQTVTVPKLAGARTIVGAPAYLLNLGNAMVLLGTVTPLGRSFAISGTWNWTTALSGAPAAGQIGIAQATWSTGTGPFDVRISKTTAGGTNLGTNLLRSAGGLIRIDAGANWAEYDQALAGVDNGTWVALRVSGNARASAGAPPPAGTPVVFSIIP
jgi:hypothetical protein